MMVCVFLVSCVLSVHMSLLSILDLGALRFCWGEEELAGDNWAMLCCYGISLLSHNVHGLLSHTMDKCKKEEECV